MTIFEIRLKTVLSIMAGKLGEVVVETKNEKQC